MTYLYLVKVLSKKRQTIMRNLETTVYSTMFLSPRANTNENVKLHVRYWCVFLLLFIVQVHNALAASPAFQIQSRHAVARTPKEIFPINRGRKFHMLAPNAQPSIATDVDAHINRSRAEEEAMMLLPNQSDLAEDTSVPFAVTLKRRGVSRVNGGLNRETAYNLQTFIDDILESSLEEVNTFKIPRAFRFANVLEKGNRFDLLLPFDDDDDDAENTGDSNEQSSSPPSKIILEAMNELLGENGKISPILEELVGKNAILYELACLISDPGSNRQEIHPDIVFDPENEDQVPLIASLGHKIIIH